MIKKKVLIIEDDESIRRFLARRMSGSGFDAVTAEDGVSGLEKAKLETPDLIILDLRLPKLSGEEVCRAIREDRNKRFAAVPIIMLTGKTDDVDHVIGRVLGANIYMTKPFQAKTLLEEIHKFVGDTPNASMDA